MTEQERRALFFKVTGQVYALTSMGIYNAFCKGLEAGYEAGRKDENEACASLEVHLITPTRDYTTMSPLDCYEAALMDEAMAFRAAIRARREQ